jgi:hypothetical protein
MTVTMVTQQSADFIAGQTDTQADRRKRKFSFFANALLKDKKENGQPSLNFLSGFLCLASFSTFASRAVLFVEKFTNKTRTPFGKLAKELNSARKTKTPTKKFSFAPASWTVAFINQNFRNFDSSMKKYNSHKMTIFTTILLSVSLSFSGCEKIDVPKGTPKCIKQKIREDNKQSGCLNAVYEYECNGAIVYYFEYDCPTFVAMPPTIIDTKCNDFNGCNLNVATNKKLIWKR